MIVEKMKTTIRERSQQIASTNPLMMAARNGTLRQPQVVKYLNNLMYFFQHTPVHLGLAYERARELGYNEVADFMKEKIGEEKGHDLWAKNDLKNNSCPQDSVDLSKITPTLNRFLEYAKILIQQDPSLFLAYMTSCEYATVLAGPELLHNLETYCGIPISSMTAVAYHEQLDRHHVDQDMEIINRVVRDEEHEKQMMEAALRSLQMIDGFLGECLVTAQ